MPPAIEVRVRRYPCHLNRLRAYRLLADGVEVARVNDGETVTFELGPGTRELVAKVDWVESAPFDLAEIAGAKVGLVDCTTSAHPAALVKASLGFRSKHITLTAGDPTRVLEAAPQGRQADLGSAGLWLVGCLCCGFMAQKTAINLALSPAVESRVVQVLWMVSGALGVLGACWIAMGTRTKGR